MLMPAFAPEESAEFEASEAAGVEDEVALGADVTVDNTAVDTTVVTIVRPVGAGTTVDEVIVANSSIAPRERRGSLLQLHLVLLCQQQYSPPWPFCRPLPLLGSTTG
jgi:hypothetical protein